jgi:transcriptional regulator with XRE-family HTH domain
MKHIFAERIRQARQYRGWTQEKLAQQIGITRSALNQIERQRSGVYAERIRDVARVLHVDGRFLLGLSDEMEDAIK